MSALICGSMAFDTIMVFQDHFKNHILPEQVHILNVSFLVPDMRREFGGCAGNIAYNLHLLEETALPMATVGRDFGPYADWMDGLGLSREHLKQLNDDYTGQAFITTDLDDNQITAFHPGAMNSSHLNHVPTNANIKIGMVSPDGKLGMEQHALEFADAGIPFIFDPGQGLPMFNGEELNRFIELADWVTVNDYEMKLIQDRTGRSPNEIADSVQAVIVTRGKHGSHIYTRDKRFEIPNAPITTALDPTGCGDAYRGGLLYGLLNGMDWETTGRIASLMGAIKIEHAGTQNHRPTLDEIRERFKNNFEYDF